MSTTEKRLAWGILGTGKIAHAFAEGLAVSRTGKLVAVGSRRLASAEKFAAPFSARAHGSYEALLADPAVEAVYISALHPFHAEWSIKAARAKKHILCEKPFTMNHAEALEVVEAARANGVFLMEAFMYRCHPQIAKLVELLRAKAIGEVGVIQATFSFHAEFDAEHRLFKNELGGGGILDVGCYVASITRLVAGAAQGLPFANPARLTGYAKLHPEIGTDLYSVAAAEFPGGILAQLAAGVSLNQELGLRVYGSTGHIHMPLPFFVHSDHTGTIFLQRKGAPAPEKIMVAADKPIFGLEADVVGDAIARKQLESTAMPVADTLGNMAMLDAWRAAVGLVYKSEKRK